MSSEHGPIFDVDAKGLAKILERRGRKFVLLELIQNALDEEGITEIEVSVAPSATRGYHWIRVTDNSPEGFKDLRHAYTLFAESAKKANVEQRGRWNLGEKLVIAMCRFACIETTTATITFENGARTIDRRKHSNCGSVFTGECRMNRDEATEAVEAARSVIVPPGIRLTVNSEPVQARVALDVAELTLPTEIADDDGYMKKTRRKTRVHVYRRALVLTAEGGAYEEQAHLYELGIPVVPIECEWHIDVEQKIPLNSDRDNVTPAYLREILTGIVNLMHKEIGPEMAAMPWVGEALGSPDVTVEAITSLMRAKHGDKRVAFDPSDPEGTKIAVSRGYEVIHGRSYTKAQWASIRRADAILPAGKVTPSPKPFVDGGESLKMLDTPGAGHRTFEAYARRFAKAVLGIDVAVRFADDPSWPFQACYGPGRLMVNVHGKPRWFTPKVLGTDDSVLAEVDELLIHEFAHHHVRDHLSNAFHEECCRIGAKLARTLRQYERDD